MLALEAKGVEFGRVGTGSRTMNAGSAQKAPRTSWGGGGGSTFNLDAVGEDDGDAMEDATMEHEVWEHRTGHVMVPAKDGLLVIGGLAYNGEFQNDVQHIRVF